MTAKQPPAGDSKTANRLRTAKQPSRPTRANGQANRRQADTRHPDCGRRPLHRRLWRSLLWHPAKSFSRRPMAEQVRRSPRRAAADLRHHRQHHFQCRDRVRTRRLRNDNDDKLHGTAEIDRSGSISSSAIRSAGALGVDLVPIGYQSASRTDAVYSVLRRALNGLIQRPGRCRRRASRDVVDGVKYQLMLSMANEDFGARSISYAG